MCRRIEEKTSFPSRVFLVVPRRPLTSFRTRRRSTRTFIPPLLRPLPACKLPITPPLKTFVENTSQIICQKYLIGLQGAAESSPDGLAGGVFAWDGAGRWVCLSGNGSASDTPLSRDFHAPRAEKPRFPALTHTHTQNDQNDDIKGQES